MFTWGKYMILLKKEALILLLMLRMTWDIICKKPVCLFHIDGALITH